MNWRTRSIVVLAAAWGCFGWLSTAGAQDWAQKMFDHLEYDFGSVARGAEAQHRFPIKNLYKEDVHVSTVYSSCGCTKPHITQDLIRSGETSYVVADFDTRSFQGPHSATLTVRFDGQFSGEVQLQVKGNIRKDVVFIPGKIDLGTIDAGTPVERKVNVAYAGRSDWQIVDVRSANSNFEVELNPKDRSAGRVNYELLFRLKPTAQAGYINDRLTIVTNDEANRQIPLAVEGNIVASLTVSPSSLQFGTVKVGKKVSKQLIVKGKNEFRVLRVECDDPSFKCQVSDQAKKLHLIPVTFEGDKPGKYVRKLRIITDAASGSLPDVVAHVIVEGAPPADTSDTTPKKGDEASIAEKPITEKPATPAAESAAKPEAKLPANEPAAKPPIEPVKPAGGNDEKGPSARKSRAWRISGAGQGAVALKAQS